MKYCCEVERKKIQNRLNRIVGQVNALKKRFDENCVDLESDPYETVRQLATIKGGLNGMITSFIEHYAKGHLLESIKGDKSIEAEAGIDNLLEIIRVYGK